MPWAWACKIVCALISSVKYTTSDYLVILRENMEAPGIQLLLDQLRLSLRAAAGRLPELGCAL